MDAPAAQMLALRREKGPAYCRWKDHSAYFGRNGLKRTDATGAIYTFRKL